MMVLTLLYRIYIYVYIVFSNQFMASFLIISPCGQHKKHFWFSGVLRVNVMAAVATNRLITDIVHGM